jgi:hypothetical protein
MYEPSHPTRSRSFLCSRKQTPEAQAPTDELALLSGGGLRTPPEVRRNQRHQVQQANLRAPTKEVFALLKK